jgi:hypothetical protein
MNRLLNILVIGIGIIQVVIGFIKLFGLIDSVEFEINQLTYTIPTMDSLFYIVTINFIGGIAFIVHSFNTFNLRYDQNKLIALSKLNIFSALVILIISFWLIIENIVLVSGIGSDLALHWPFLLASLLLFFPIALLPLLLAFKNLTTNNKITKLIDSEKNKELRKKLSKNRNSSNRR